MMMRETYIVQLHTAAITHWLADFVPQSLCVFDNIFCREVSSEWERNLSRATSFKSYPSANPL
jgi:hypothetical protein